MQTKKVKETVTCQRKTYVAKRGELVFSNVNLKVLKHHLRKWANANVPDMRTLGRAPGQMYGFDITTKMVEYTYQRIRKAKVAA